MNSGMTTEEFIDSLDTVDFIFRQSEYLSQYIKENPNILFTQTLQGGYVIAYSNIKEFESLLRAVGTSFISSASVVLGTLDRASLEAQESHRYSSNRILI